MQVVDGLSEGSWKYVFTKALPGFHCGGMIKTNSKTSGTTARLGAATLLLGEQFEAVKAAIAALPLSYFFYLNTILQEFKLTLILTNLVIGSIFLFLVLSVLKWGW